MRITTQPPAKFYHLRDLGFGEANIEQKRIEHHTHEGIAQLIKHHKRQHMQPHRTRHEIAKRRDHIGPQKWHDPAMGDGRRRIIVRFAHAKR